MERSRPAQVFESKTGFTGLSRDYVLSADFHEEAQSLLGVVGRTARGGMTTPHSRSEAIISDACDFAQQFNSLSWPISKLSRDWASTLHQRLNGLIDKVVSQNPGAGLEHVPIDRNDLGQVRHFLLGVTSGFIPEDIQYYMHDMPQTPDYTVFDELVRRGARITEDMPLFEGYMNSVHLEALGHKIGTNIGWRPSPQTLDAIKRQADLEDWSPNAQELEAAEIEVLNRAHHSVRYSQPPSTYDERLEF